MNNPDQLKLFFSLFLGHLPTLIICAVAVISLLSAGGSLKGSGWALSGFGLALILCFVMPIGQVFLQQWVFQSGEQVSRMWAFTAFGIVGSVLHAVIYVFLLTALLAGRTKP